MQPNTEKEIDMDNKSVHSRTSNRSKLSKKKEDDLMSVISQLSHGTKKSNRS